jgi:hypothetical protein
MGTGAACVHDVWRLDMKEDNSYYTRHWREKHRANQIAKDSSLFCLPMKCSGCDGRIEDQYHIIVKTLFSQNHSVIVLDYTAV